MSKSPYDILVRPVITEQALEAQKLNKYTFEVAIGSNKTEIRQAVEKAFGVKVVDVNTVRTGGKTVRRQRMRPGKTADVKKAIVTLAEGQALEFS